MVIAGTRDPGTIAPFGSGGARRDYVSILFETLARVDSDGKLVNCIAKNIESKGNGVYRVEIYDYVKDSKGNLVKASDIKFSYEQFTAEGSFANLTANLDHIDIINDYTLDFCMDENEKVGAFNAMMNAVYIISEKAWNDSPDQMALTPVGTSPYKLNKFTPNAECRFIRNENYWQTDESLRTVFQQAYADTITIKIITDQSTVALAMENGDIDYTQSMSMQDLPNFINADGSKKDGYGVGLYPNANMVHILFNCAEGHPTADINLRKAIAFAIDANAIAYAQYLDHGHAAETLINHATLDYDGSRDGNFYYTQNIELAKEYLSKSSYKEGDVVRMIVDPGVDKGAVVMQDQLRQIGITLELLQYDNALYKSIEMGEGDEYDIDFIYMNSNGTYGYEGLRTFDGGNYSNGLPRIYITDSNLEKLFDTASAAATASSANTNALIDYIVDEQCYARPMYWFDKTFAWRDKITSGVVIDGSYLPIYGAFEIGRIAN